jgi:hypothetical protein
MHKNVPLQIAKQLFNSVYQLCGFKRLIINNGYAFFKIGELYTKLFTAHVDYFNGDGCQGGIVPEDYLFFNRRIRL